MNWKSISSWPYHFINGSRLCLVTRASQNQWPKVSTCALPLSGETNLLSFSIHCGPFISPKRVASWIHLWESFEYDDIQSHAPVVLNKEVMTKGFFMTFSRCPCIDSNPARINGALPYDLLCFCQTCLRTYHSPVSLKLKLLNNLLTLSNWILFHKIVTGHIRTTALMHLVWKNLTEI